jgi:hypothetical protein|tara:strand:- start:205 stop:414 length:210 start_codon:yes stop_codon:yes gene_type:complete
MTYKELQKEYKIRNNKSISTCAIADAKHKLGYPVKISINRKEINKVQKTAKESELLEIAIILKNNKASP